MPKYLDTILSMKRKGGNKSYKKRKNVHVEKK